MLSIEAPPADTLDAAVETAAKSDDGGPASFKLANIRAGLRTVTRGLTAYE
jgi:hypothetical protein